jgi:CO/xanthine dehydrogenase FAD-binding subunit
MIVEYHRPDTIERALKILARKIPRSYPLGGGTVLSHGSSGDYAVVDLQDLHLNEIEFNDQGIQVGATITLQQLFEYPGLPESLTDVIKREASQNIRNQATLAGTIVSSDGKSCLLAALLALDSHLIWEPGNKKVGIGDWLSLRQNWDGGLLITHIEVPLIPILKYACVSRAPLEQPMVCTAVGKWPSGRTRIVIGGWGSSPSLVLDGPNADGAEYAAQIACSHLSPSELQKYISLTTTTLIKRLIETHT